MITGCGSGAPFLLSSMNDECPAGHQVAAGGLGGRWGSGGGGEAVGMWGSDGGGRPPRRTNYVSSIWKMQCFFSILIAFFLFNSLLRIDMGAWDVVGVIVWISCSIPHS